METQTQGSGNKNGGVAIATGFPDYSDDVRAIGDRIVNLTLTQAVQLSEYLEQAHGIKIASTTVQYKEQDEKIPEKLPEKTEFDVIYEGFDPNKKIGLIKVYREITNVAIKEAKDFIEAGIDKPIKQDLSKVEAELLKTKLEQAGAKISLR